MSSAARVSSFVNYGRRRRLWVPAYLTVDCVSWAIGLLAAMVVRFDGIDWGDASTSRFFLAVFVACALVVAGTVVGFRRRGLARYGSFEEVARTAALYGVVAVLLLAANRVGPSRLVPDSVVLAGSVGAFVIAGGARYAYRLLRERRNRPLASAEPVLVFGAGEGGDQTITAMVRDPKSPYRPVALLDDDPSKQGLLIRGVKVEGGRDDMAAVARRFGATTMVIAIPGAHSDLIRGLVNQAIDAGLTTRVLPPTSELFGLPVGVEDIRPITEVDLLGRDEVETDLTAIAGYLQDRRVLVTGAGGSIGSEICRQVALFGPRELVMLDRDESALHALQLEIEGRAMLDSRNLVVADIRDRERMFDVFAEHKPHVVFHAAALKHLPLLEMHPAEALKSNVFGTKNVLDAAAAASSVDRFVNISTDKAADPCSMLGYSKRLAEGLTAAAARRYDGRFLSVRFGNVLGSRGSVLTAFEAQIAAGGPLTVTHPDVTRYFMTVTEAVHLVVQAGAVGGPGEALVLDMGEPVKIAEVAVQLAAQSKRPIDIVYTGLRPAEKLHEALLAEGEADERPAHPLISHVQVPVLDDDAIAFLQAVRGDDAAASAMRDLANTVMHPTRAQATDG
jgi:FlaA1/EpsC-like NDP-sugar epimerase